MRWSRILALEVLPWMALVVFLLGFWAGLSVGLWKLYTSKLSKGAKIGISFAIFGPGLLFPPVQLYFRQRRSTQRARQEFLSMSQTLREDLVRTEW